MKSAKILSAVLMLATAGLATISCGEDEASGGPGRVIGEGGEGGEGATGGTGRGGSGGGGGTSGTGGSVGANGTRLGGACESDAECEDAKAPGLICIKPTDRKLGGGAPPKGLCSQACTGDAACDALSPGSLCVPFDNTNSFCMEPCTFGLAASKCHNRVEFSCSGVATISTGVACVDSGGCGDGEICTSAGTCGTVIPTCLPACTGDLDCAAGLFCDPSVGTCVNQKPTGKPIGSPCSLEDDADEDECVGFCAAFGDAAGKAVGRCSEGCALGNPCAWDADAKRYGGLCGWVPFYETDAESGDFGYCTQGCSCNDECTVDAHRCIDQSTVLTSDFFLGGGLCSPNTAKNPELTQCTDGSGGAPSGSEGGAAGAPVTGSAGAPAGSSGAPGAGGTEGLGTSGGGAGGV